MGTKWRFSQEGKVCSGDYSLTDGSTDQYLAMSGKFIQLYVISYYALLGLSCCIPVTFLICSCCCGGSREESYLKKRNLDPKDYSLKNEMYREAARMNLPDKCNND